MQGVLKAIGYSLLKWVLDCAKTVSLVIMLKDVRCFVSLHQIDGRLCLWEPGRTISLTDQVSDDAGWHFDLEWQIPRKGGKGLS